MQEEVLSVRWCYRVENIIYKCVPSVDWFTRKVYFVTAENNFKWCFHNHWMSFNNKDHFTYPALFKYGWEIKTKWSLKWSIGRSVPAYLNISKKCQLCLQENVQFFNYPNPNELLNK